MIPAQKNNGNKAETGRSATSSVQEARKVPVDPVDGGAEGENKRTKKAIVQRKCFPANNKGEILPGQGGLLDVRKQRNTGCYQKTRAFSICTAHQEQAPFSHPKKAEDCNMDRKSWSLESNTLKGQFFNNSVINGRPLIYRMAEEPSWRYPSRAE